MSQFFETQPATNSIDFNDFVDALNKQGDDLFSQHNIEKNKALLQRLYMNKTFLVEYLCKHALSTKPDDENSYTYQVFMLHTDKHYIVRANIWQPESLTVDDNVFSYGFAHDHNFDLLTLGYFGSGYETLLCEYDPNTIQGKPSESVNLYNLKRLKLYEGSVLYMQQSKDVHVQYPSNELSISINIMGRKPSKHPQLQFDIESKKIAKPISGRIEDHYEKLYSVMSCSG